MEVRGRGEVTVANSALIAGVLKGENTRCWVTRIHSPYKSFLKRFLNKGDTDAFSGHKAQ